MSLVVKEYTTKKAALKNLQDNQILCNRNITKYFILEDYKQFVELLGKNNYYEFIPENTLVNLFMDIEIYEKDTEFYNSDLFIERIKDVLKTFFNNYHLMFYILESHTTNINDIQKKSYHVIVRMLNENKQAVYFKNVLIVKNIISTLFPKETGKKIIDTSVYREGLFRTISSSKKNEDRPLKISCSSQYDNDNVIYFFVAYCPEKDCEIYKQKKDMELVEFKSVDSIPMRVKEHVKCKEIGELTVLERNNISKFVKTHFKQQSKDIIVDTSINCIVVSVQDKYCYNINREHKSNHQYILIDSVSAKQKCHDVDCKYYKHNEILSDKYPNDISLLILNNLKINKTELELVNETVNECRTFINENFDIEPESLLFDKNEMIFKGSASVHSSIKLKGNCTNCQVEHQISNTGYCLKCIVCKSIFPRNTRIPIDPRFKNLNSFWMNYTQLINTGTINNNVVLNIYNNSEDDFSCDVNLDNTIFRSKELTALYNQILDGHKIVKLSELLKKQEGDFVYSNGEWYYFNGTIWVCDEESLELRRRIVKLSNNFNKIKQYYENKSNNESNVNIIKNIKTLITKLHKTSFEDDIIKGAKMYYNNKEFKSFLNSKKHLVPFNNGVYDLLENKFRKTKKEDYVNLTLKFNYNPAERNQEIITFLNQVLPDPQVRDYMLKKLSECLNGDIPNTNFLMLIGNGANGKSQLLNLMKYAMGELGEKMEVTLLTRKRTNANEANTEKIKLMNKRFAYLSEPEDGERINISLLKELTGSEEIVARGLYKDSVAFVMEAKLFLACNELPDIKGEDTALWRRIKVINFPSRFVDNPKESNEFKIDRTLPSRMRETLAWKQTFLNILIEFYYKDIIEPDQVKINTNEYRENNDVTDFILRFSKIYMTNSGKGVKWSDVWELFQDWYFKENSENVKQKKIVIKKYFQEHIFKSKDVPIRNIGRGWSNWSINHDAV